MAASLIVAGIAAGTSIYAAHKGAAAAKDAAKQQQAGAREARAYAEPLYQQAQAGLAPYVQQGQQGLYALSDFLGVPRAPVTAAPGAPGPVAAPVGHVPPPGAPVVGQAIPRPGGPIPRAGAPATAPQQATQSSYVTLRAPTGQTQPVPAEHVDYYLARGATRV